MAQPKGQERNIGTMYIPQDRAVLALQLLLEGNSIRSTERITNLDRNTVMSLLMKAGERCGRMMHRKIEHLDVKDVEADEIWGFVGKKEVHKSLEDGSQFGDAYCFIAMERNTKLVLAYHLGKRSRTSTKASANTIYSLMSREKQLFAMSDVIVGRARQLGVPCIHSIAEACRRRF